MKDELLKEWEAFGAGDNEGENNLALRILKAVQQGVFTSADAEQAMARGQARVFGAMWERFQQGKLFSAQHQSFMGAMLMLPAERKRDLLTWEALRSAAQVTGEQHSEAMQEMNSFCHVAVAIPLALLQACTDMKGGLLPVESWTPTDSDAWDARRVYHDEAFKAHPAWDKW